MDRLSFVIPFRHIDIHGLVRFIYWVLDIYVMFIRPKRDRFSLVLHSIQCIVVLIKMKGIYPFFVVPASCTVAFVESTVAVCTAFGSNSFCSAFAASAVVAVSKTQRLSLLYMISCFIPPILVYDQYTPKESAKTPLLQFCII